MGSGAGASVVEVVPPPVDEVTEPPLEDEVAVPPFEDDVAVPPFEDDVAVPPFDVVVCRPRVEVVALLDEVAWLDDEPGGRRGDSLGCRRGVHHLVGDVAHGGDGDPCGGDVATAQAMIMAALRITAHFHSEACLDHAGGCAKRTLRGRQAAVSSSVESASSR